MSAVIVDDQFRARIEAFVAHCTELKTKYYAANYTNLTPPRHELEYGDKWAKIWQVDTSGTSRSCYAFVALCDFENKQLGKVKQGDIHKPASWKAPAKHSRGSVFNVDFNNCAGPHGIQYLR